MLPCQRSHFDIPRDVAYLNAASYSPLPRATQEAARAAVGRKGQPWRLEISTRSRPMQSVRCRTAAARLINAEPNDVALIPSVAYGVAVAGNFSRRRAARASSCSRTIIPRRCSNGMRGRRPVDFRSRPCGGPPISIGPPRCSPRSRSPGAAPLSLVSISSVHWCDGVLLDVARDRGGGAGKARRGADRLDAERPASSRSM